MISIKLDEDLPYELVGVMQAKGFDVSNVRLQGWTGRPDKALLAGIQAEGRWLLTADKGFSDIRRYTRGLITESCFFDQTEKAAEPMCIWPAFLRIGLIWKRLVAR